MPFGVTSPGIQINLSTTFVSGSSCYSIHNVRDIDNEIHSYFVIAHKTNISTPTVSISKHIQKLLTNRGGSRGNIGGASPKTQDFLVCLFFLNFAIYLKTLRLNKINKIKW